MNLAECLTIATSKAGMCKNVHSLAHGSQNLPMDNECLDLCLCLDSKVLWLACNSYWNRVISIGFSLDALEVDLGML